MASTAGANGEHAAAHAPRGEVVVDDSDACVPIGLARVARHGSDVTVAAIGSMVPEPSGGGDARVRHADDPFTARLGISNLCLRVCASDGHYARKSD